MSEPRTPKPDTVDRDGVITDRATGQRVGWVGIRNGEWTGYWQGPDYPGNPWQQEIVKTLAGRRWSIAKAVWKEHLRRTADGEPSSGVDGPGAAPEVQS